MKLQNSDHDLRKVFARSSLFNELLVAALVIFFVLPVSASVDIVITGADEVLTKNVQAHVGKIDIAEFRNSRLLEQRLNSLISQSVQVLGYYHCEWSIVLSPESVVIDLKPGVAVVLLDPDIQLIGPAAELPAFSNIIKLSSLALGEQLDHSKYDELKKALMQKAQGMGFFDAVYRESELLVNVQNNTAKIKLIMESGQRYQFGALSFEGSQLDRAFLQSIATFKQHDPYERKDLASFRRKLYETGYFSSVSIDSQRIIEDGLKQVKLSVSLEDSSRHQFEVGLGFDTDNGPRVRFNWDMPIIGSRGHSWNSIIEVSKPEQEISATYRIPLSEPLTKFLLFDTGYAHQEIESTESSLLNAGVSKLNLKENNWQLRYGVSADYENYRQAGGDWTDVFYLVPHINWVRSGFDQDANPTKGYRLWLSLSGSSTEIGADTSFFKTHIGARWLTPIGKTNFRVLTRFELGAIATSDILQVPVSRRFYTGGDQTIRGYSYHTVATRDEDGELVGGSFLNVGSMELSGRLSDQWRGAIFADTGRAYEDSDEPFSSSVGVGARWLSVVGEVRVDLAHPLDDEGTNIKLHISMGPPL